MSQIVSLQPLPQAADFILAFSTMVGAAFVYQRSRRAAAFVALGGAIATILIVVDGVFMYSANRFLGPDVTFYGMQLAFITRHVVYFGALALALHTIAKEQRAR